MRITTTRILGGGSDSDVCVVLNRVEPRAPETVRPNETTIVGSRK